MSASADAIPCDYNFAADILKRNLDAGRGDKAAYIDHRSSYTYAALAARVERFGHVLRALDIRREERVLMCLLDTIDWPTAFLGAIKAGVVAVPVNTLLTEDDYRFMLEDFRARLLVVSEELLPKFAKAIAASKTLAHVIVSGNVIVSGDDAQDHQRFDDLLAAAKADAVTAPTTRDDMCFWLYTSGSTGKPKGAVHTHADLKLTDDLYAAPDPRPHRKRRLLFGGEAVFRLWPRQCADLPDVGRRHDGAAAAPADARPCRRHSQDLRGHRVLCGPDILCRLPRQSRRTGARRGENTAAACRPAKRCRPTSGGAGASVTVSIFSMASAPPKCCTSFSPIARAT